MLDQNTRDRLSFSYDLQKRSLYVTKEKQHQPDARKKPVFRPRIIIKVDRVKATAPYVRKRMK
ncbi:MAG TPA: hypothetical protein VN397_02860 [Candidatus Methylomirabilis sp.]|nr:hypothetical protein [Candidatus Methylomirabilis sp.]